MRDAERIARVEHAAPAAEREHRRLQQARKLGHLGGGILRAAAGDDQDALGGAEALGGVAIASSSIGAGAGGAGAAIGGTGALRPHTSIAHSSTAGPGRPRAHGAHRGGDQARRLLRRADAGGEIGEPRDDAGLVADLVQMAVAAADRGLRDVADQRQHRRVGAVRVRRPVAELSRPGPGTTV